jgi:hypothetical protein
MPQSKCKFCTAPIIWVDRERKKVPLSLNGRDHRETCIGKPIHVRQEHVNANHEIATAAFLRSVQGSTSQRNGYSFR